MDLLKDGQNLSRYNDDFKVVEDIMTKEKAIKILMMDKCTRIEAEKYFKNGTEIFVDFEEHFEDYMKEWCMEEDDITRHKKMIDEKIPMINWGIVDVDGKTYYIMYVV